MKATSLIAALLIVTGLSGCSEPVIDASSKESMKVSTQAIRDTLSETEQVQFDDALKLIAFSQLDMKSLFSSVVTGEGNNLEAKVRDALDGKTASEVIEQAARVKDERDKRARQQAMEEIKELEEKFVVSDKAKEELARFEVFRSRLYMEDKRFGPDQPIIELTVKNGTGSIVSRAYFKGTLSSVGRKVPWHEDTFNYSIPGGLEPGEEQSWRLAPNLFSDWAKVKAPNDAVFTVVAEKLDGIDGETILSSVFTKQDGKRLADLKSKYMPIVNTLLEDEIDGARAEEEKDWNEIREARNLTFFEKNKERILRLAQQALDDKYYYRALKLTDDYKSSDNQELHRIRSAANQAIDSSDGRQGW